MSMNRRVEHQRGFSLIEVVIGVLVLSLVLAGFYGIYKQVLDTDYKMAEQAKMARIDQALNTFLAVNAYLPCPDTDGDGLEDRVVSGGVARCDKREGGLPFNDLGVEEKDAWGNAYYYRVHQRAAQTQYVNQVCEPASVLGLAGPRGTDHLWLCPESNLYYCANISGANNCNDACSQACTNTTDPRPVDSVGLPPFFHLATPPYGSISGSLNLLVYNEAGAQLEEGVVAVVVSWGANGDQVNRARCGGGSDDENENCDNDRSFVDTQTGENRDFITWVTVNQAKVAIIGTGRLR
jgi:prepilin-type N-terminal cleavage/methylation domain-containing protein